MRQRVSPLSQAYRPRSTRPSYVVPAVAVGALAALSLIVVLARRG